MSMRLWLSVLALCAAMGSAHAQSPGADQRKTQLLAQFQSQKNTDQPAAYRAARTYLNEFPQMTATRKYLQAWTSAYERVAPAILASHDASFGMLYGGSLPAFSVYIAEEATRGRHAIQDAAFLASGDYSFLLDANVAYSSAGVPGGIGQAVTQMRAVGPIRRLSLSPAGGWVVIAGANAFTAAGIPEDCHQALIQLNSQHHYIQDVSFSANGGWVILWDRNGYNYSGIANALVSALSSLNSRGVNIQRVAFAANGGWVIIYDRNNALSQGVPPPLTEALDTLRSQNRAIRVVAFAPQGGWFLKAD